MNRSNYFLALTLASLTFSEISQAQYTKEEVVEEFVAIGNGQRGRTRPAFSNPFPIPRLNEVIPQHLQRRMRNRQTQGSPTFEGYTPSVDLRHRDTPVLSQVGSRCSAYGLIASIENLLGAPNVAKLSEAHLWSAYRKYSSETAVEAAKKMTITESEMWPHDRSNPTPGWEQKRHTKLNHITYIEDDLTRAVEALQDGRSVYLGVSVTKSFANCDPVMDPKSPDTGGGHAVGISGYAIDKRVPGGGYFIIKNSWSKDCGDKGYQYMPFNYCSRKGSSYCIMWDLQGVSTKFPGVPGVEPEIPEFDLTRMDVRISSYSAWYRRNRTVVISIAGDSLHARQIKNVSYSVDGGAFSKPVANALDAVDLSFVTVKGAHKIALKYVLHNGEVFESTHSWRL